MLPNIDDWVLSVCLLVCFSLIMDDNSQNMFLGVDCVTCANCSLLQQVIATIILYLQQYGM